MGFLNKLDTNGYHPEILKKLLGEGLTDYVAMDIKNSPEKYAMTAGLEKIEMDRILESIRVLMESGTDYEFRTTVVSQLHEAQDFEEIGRMIRGAKRYFLQQFTDRDSVPFGNLTAPDQAQMEAFAAVARQYVPETQLRGV